MSTNTENIKNNQTEVIGNNKTSSRAKTVAAGAVAVGAAAAGVGTPAAMYNDGAFGSATTDSSATTNDNDVALEEPVVVEEENRFDDMSFADAFKTARAEGMETFEWNGKLYGTKLASEVEPQDAPQENQLANNSPEDVIGEEEIDGLGQEIPGDIEQEIDEELGLTIEDGDVIIPEEDIVQIDYTDAIFTDPVAFDGNVALATNDEGREDLLIDVNNDGYADITVTNTLAENPDDMDIHMINNDSAYIGVAEEEYSYDPTGETEEYIDYNDTDDIVADAY